uniref:Uncharacterized protein n=1 Tax=Romanomermis culicivorax TaxID=13658 RepID=A0A915K5R4_ROMCU
MRTATTTLNINLKLTATTIAMIPTIKTVLAISMTATMITTITPITCAPPHQTNTKTAAI